MKVMGTNTWEADMPKKPLVHQALKFADMVKEQGIAELQEAYISADEKLMWCTWETENLEALQEAFNQMNAQSGLKSELRIVEKM
jgi:hypothetical protein